MSVPPTDQPIAPKPTQQKPIRLWPGIAAVVLQWLAWFVVPLFVPQVMMYGMLVGVICALAVLVWWLFFSRAPWVERVGAIVLMVLAVVVTKRFVHPSIAGGMMGMMLPVFSIPVLCLALVVSLVATRRVSRGPRRAIMAAVILLACGLFTLIRTGGITGDARMDLHSRWTRTPEEKLLAQAGDEPTTPLANAPAAATNEKNSNWPGFRGPKRDSIVRDGVRIETDWTGKPPVALWRRPVGPGWSSFAVQDNLLYTQEQRGNDELVSCYNLTTGQPVWRHRDAARFYESNAGAGPRGTPTLSNGRVYTFGATGILNALDGRNGSVVWSRNAASDTKTKVPTWAFASSPLVIGDVVIVATAGSLAAYDVATGNQRWLGPTTARGAESSGPGLTHVALTARFRALGACEPRQIREEAALSRTSQVPRARLARAGDGSAARGVRFEGGARDRALRSRFLEGKEPGMERSDELVGLIHAEPLNLSAKQDATDWKITTRADARLQGRFVLPARATAQRDGHPVISETAIEVEFLPAVSAQTQR